MKIILLTILALATDGTLDRDFLDCQITGTGDSVNWEYPELGAH